MTRPPWVALQFLTRLPLPSMAVIEDRERGHSLLWYPLVGLLIAGLLALLAWVFSNLTPLLRAALLLAAWTAITGALHLDGLADSADAWMGGHGSRERSLAIMQDPHCGAGAVVVVVLVLLLKFAALENILAADRLGWLWLAPVLGRTAVPLLFLTTPYVRPGGIGDALAKHIPRRAAWVVLAITLVVVLGTGEVGVLAIMSAALMFFLLRAMMLRRIQGTTGDTAGAMVELVEMAVLLAVALST